MVWEGREPSKPINIPMRASAGLRFCRAAYTTYVGTMPRQEDALFVDGLAILPSSQNHRDAANTPLMSERECKIPCVFAVADGMGGQGAGDIASETCICRIMDFCQGLPAGIALRDVIEGIQSLIHSTSMELCSMAARDIRLKDMGTTLVVLIVCIDGCAILSIGDSRAYSFKDETLLLLTRDDTEGQRLLDLGLVASGELDGIEDRDCLLRYVGMGHPGLIVKASEQILPLKEQAILLCSDGVSKALKTCEIESVLCGSQSLLGGVEALVLTASSRDGSDNVSAILVRIG